MCAPRLFAICGIAVLTVASVAAHAEEKAWRLNLPKRNKPTPVQQFNRDGVKAVRNHDYEKAKKLFYRAYLLDPDDPFTLNNLGYIAELEGDVERAQRYYDLAGQHKSEALVDASDNEALKGKPVERVAGNAEDNKLEVNRLNVQALALLLKDRAPEADLLLQKALQIQSQNPFTLNNMGYAKEKEGEYEAAQSYYTAAARQNSQDPIVVAVEKNWRGRAISDVAAENAKALEKLIKKEDTREARVARLNLQGVSALNRNDRNAARKFFEQAYNLDPQDAFALNNMGLLAELDNDRETAEFYYAKAREARRSNARVTVATRRDAEGRRLYEVADTSQQKVEARMVADVDARRRQGGEVQLKTRDNRPVIEPKERPKPTESSGITVTEREEVVQQPAPQQGVAQPQNNSAATPAAATPTAPVSGQQTMSPEQQQRLLHEYEIPTPDDEGAPAPR